MLTGRREAVESSLNKTSRSATRAVPKISTHAVPEHFDVACWPASAELSKKKSSRKSPRRKTPTYNRASKVHQDMLRNSSLSFAQAIRQRKIDGRTVLQYFRSDFEKDSSGRIKARPKGRRWQTLYIPGFEPGQQIPVPSKNASERRVVGRWMASLNAARGGDFSKMDKFPRNKSIGGVRLPTSRNEVQRILRALAETKSPFEGLYGLLRRREVDRNDDERNGPQEFLQ